jgi:hypothetical protein
MPRGKPPSFPLPAGLTPTEMDQAFADARILLDERHVGRALPSERPTGKAGRARAIDKTDQGDQFVMPGAERRTLPKSVHSVEPDGQLLIAGEAPVTDAERAQMAVDAPLRPRRGQKAPPASGLFGVRGYQP